MKRLCLTRLEDFRLAYAGTFFNMMSLELRLTVTCRNTDRRPANDSESKRDASDHAP